MRIVGASIVVTFFLGLFIMVARMTSVRAAVAIIGSAFGATALIVVAVIWMCGLTVGQFIRALSQAH